MFCGADIATIVTANHLAQPYLPLFFLSICDKGATSEHTCVSWSFVYSEKNYRFICFLKRLISLGVSDFKIAGSDNIKSPLTYAEALSFERCPD